MSFGKIATTLALGGALLVGGTVPAFARNYRSCEQRVHKAELKLQKAERRHGARSRQAAKRRQELTRAREGCRFDRR